MMAYPADTVGAAPYKHHQGICVTTKKLPPFPVLETSHGRVQVRVICVQELVYSIQGHAPCERLNVIGTLKDTYLGKDSP